MGFLTGKRILVTGVISNRSIAYGIAKKCHEQGAQLAFTYVGERFHERIVEFAGEFDSTIVMPCDVSEDAQIESAIVELGKHWDGLDGLVHAIGFSPREAISGEFLDGYSRESFRIAHDISAYSFAALVKAALPLLRGRNSSVITLTYLGAERVVPHYNTMGLAKASLEAATRYLAFCLGPQGIRANAVAPGPVETEMAKLVHSVAIRSDYHDVIPLNRYGLVEEVAAVVVFLCSAEAAYVNGQVIAVDGGFEATGVGLPTLRKLATTPAH